MKTPQIKELGKNNYKLLGAAVVVFIAAIPLAVADIKAGAGALVAGIVLFLLAMLLPAKQEQAAKSAAPAAPVVASAAPVFVQKPLPAKLNMLDGLYERRYYYSNVEFESAGELPALPRGKEVEFICEGADVKIEAEDVLIGKMINNSLREMVQRWKRNNAPVLAQIYTEDPVTLEMGYYSMPGDEADYEARGIEWREYKLAGVNTGDYAFMADVAAVGDAVDVTFDPIKERFETCYGYLPKSAAEFVDDGAVGFVTFAEGDEEDKYTIKIKVYESKVWK